MATENEKTLQLVIDEQKRDYDYLLHIFDRMRATEGVLLTATFGILTYLYYIAPAGTPTSITERLFVPNEDYGKVIYFAAAGFFVYGLIKLMLNVFGLNPWMTAYETEKSDHAYDNQKSTLIYFKKRYDKYLDFNGRCYKKRKRELNFLFYCILLSAIILIVIKTLN